MWGKDTRTAYVRVRSAGNGRAPDGQAKELWSGGGYRDWKKITKLRTTTRTWTNQHGAITRVVGGSLQ